MPLSTVSYYTNASGDKIKLSEAFNKYSIISPNYSPGSQLASKNYGPIKLWLGETVETRYALQNNGETQGEATATTVTNLIEDDYGNVESMEVTTYPGNASSGLNYTLKVSTENDYLQTDNGKFYGRLTQSRATTSRPESRVFSQTRTANFTYYGMNGDCYGSGSVNAEKLTGLLCSETADHGLVTRHYYDKFGNNSYSHTIDTTMSENNSRVSAFSEFDMVGRYVESTYDVFDLLANGELPSDDSYTMNATGGVVKTSRVISRNRYGVPTETESNTGDNWLKSTAYFSPYGNPYFTASHDGSYSSTTSSQDVSNCPALTIFSTKTESAGGSELRTCFDLLGRQLRIIKPSFAGEQVWVYEDTEYDKHGRVVRSSEPYFSDAVDKYWKEYSEYDLLGRVTKILHPFNETDQNGVESTADRAISSVIYDDANLTVTHVSPGVRSTTRSAGITKIEEMNVLGETVAVTEYDPGGSGILSAITIQYEYDVYGNLTKLVHPNNAVTTMKYNSQGLKVEMNDPDKGVWSYGYNGFGDVICQKNANQQIVKSSYDFRGRLVSRTDYEGGIDEDGSSDSNSSCDAPGAIIDSASWYYDSAENGLAQISSETAEGINKSYEYDSHGRISISHTTIASDVLYAGGTHSSKVTYDQYGRLYQQYDAARENQDFTHSATQHIYNERGYLFKIENADKNADFGDRIYYEVTNKDERGKVTAANYSDGRLRATASYNPKTGLVESLKTTNDGGLTYVQNMEMKWDSLGNLALKRDLGTNSDDSARFQLENYAYDSRNRLTEYSVNGKSSTRISVDYTALGNITAKSDVGNYDYLGAGMHAVSRTRDASGNVIDYYYDANGNLTSDGRGRLLEYTPFDKVKKITRGNRETKFFYDGTRSRFKRIDKNNNALESNRESVTLYLGNVEKVHHSDYSHEWKRTIAGVVQITHKYVVGGFHVRHKSHLHKDHLGSLVAISDEVGETTTLMSYDPWGVRRDASNYEAAAMASLSDIYSSSIIEATKFFKQNMPETNRGFTGHEMIDEMGIVHMNGRIYDGVIGRFIQADPIVQSPKSIASLNRYTYLSNNPLNGTDPSGFIGIRDFFSHGLDKDANIVGSTAAFGYFSLTGDIIGTKFIYKNARKLHKYINTDPGANQIATMAACTWGTAFGCAGAAAYTAHVNGASSNEAIAIGARTLWTSSLFYAAGSMAGKNVALKIFYNAIAGGIAAEANGGEFRHGFLSGGVSAGTAVAGRRWGEQGGPVVGRLAVAAVSGGTVSYMTGGKFSNGAQTAAMSFIYNELKHPVEQKGRIGALTNQSIVNYIKYVLRNELVPDVTISTGGDVTVIGLGGIKGGLGSYITTDGGDGLPDVGKYETTGLGDGVDLDGALGITLTFGGIENLQGAGRSTSLDFMLFSLDINTNGDGTKFTGVTFSVSTPWGIQVSDSATDTKTRSYIK